MPDIAQYVRTDFREVDKRDELRTVLGWIRGDTATVPVVMDDGKPFGIVSERAMLGRRIDPKAKVEGYALTTRAVTAETTLADAMARMAEFRAAFLPVENNRGKLTGYVSALDFVHEHLPRETRARDLAIRVTTLREDQTLSEAHHAFHQEYVDFLPVLGKDGRIAGVVPRKTLILMDARQSSDKGRKDAGGERVHPQHAELTHYLDSNAPVIDGNAPLPEVIKAVRDFGCVLVHNANGDGTVAGIITAETLVQRAQGK